MFVRIPPVLGTLRILFWQWRAILFFSTSSLSLVSVHSFWLPMLELPTVVISVAGGAIGIFVSFRSHAGYDRWWEGRKLWGALVNTSRMFATQAVTYCTESSRAEGLVRRQIAYVHVLRCQLRGEKLDADADVQRFLTNEEMSAISSKSSPTHSLLHIQQQELVALNRAGKINDFRLLSFDESISRLLDVQGGCERIKNTTFPPGYGFLAERLIQALGFLLPLGLVHDLDWYSVPISVLICLAFRLIGEVGRSLENPFTSLWPALPLFSLTKTIEHNLRETLGETHLPALPRANQQGVLM